MNYLLHILILINIYAVLAVSLNLLAGYTGLLSICQAAFYGVGAYCTALISLKLGWPWLATVIAGMAIAGVIAALVGASFLRFRDDYFVIATFIFQVIIYSVMQNWIELTHGPQGLSRIPKPVILGWYVYTQWEFLIVSFLFSGFSFLVVHRLVNAPYGRTLRAIREDEVFAQSLGKNVAGYKLSAFVVGAMLAATGGSLYASYITYIDPSSFTVLESIFILAIVIIGGAGNVWGSVVGAAFLVAMPEALRFMGMPPSVAANVRQILYGLLLVVCMMWRPQGFIGEFAFRKEKLAIRES